MGDRITSLDELLGMDFVFWHKKITHIEIIKHLQYSAIITGLAHGWFYQAIEKEV